MKTRTKIPMRQCTGCREMKSKKEMIRVLRTSENEIILDATGKKKRTRRIPLFLRGMPGKGYQKTWPGAFLENGSPDESVSEPQKGVWIN